MTENQAQFFFKKMMIQLIVSNGIAEMFLSKFEFDRVAPTIPGTTSELSVNTETLWQREQGEIKKYFFR